MPEPVAPGVDGERLRRRLAELVRIPSQTGTEGAAIDCVTDWLLPFCDEVDRWTASMRELEGDPEYPGREVERAEVPVVAARVRGRRPGPVLMLTGHVDVVPTGDRRQWRVDPFAAEIQGDRLYGRGACDMKSGVVAALEALEVMGRGHRDFSGELTFVAVPGEEDGGTGTLAAIRRGWRADLAIITEPTSAEGGQPGIIVAHAGALTLTVQVEGRSAHASKRLQGESALEHYFAVHRALCEEERRLNEAETHPLMRALGLPYATSVGRVTGGEWAASVMDALEAEVRVGVALGESVQAAEERVRRAVLEGCRQDEWLARHPPRVERSGAAYGSGQTAPDHPLVETLGEAARAVFGRLPERAGAPYGCDMAAWIRIAGTPTVVYGPGDVRVAHAPNEWVSLAETEGVARVLVRAAMGVLGGS